MEYRDQLLRTVNITEHPSRIISLVPSITELLSELDLDQRIVGITKFCIHPDHIYHEKKRIGGTKKINFDAINKLNPDLIIANKEENTFSDISELEKAFPVYVTNVNTFDDSINMIGSIGTITGTSTRAEAIINKIKTNFSTLKPVDGISVLYIIWNDPFMAAGKNTFIDDMLTKCGYKNALQNTDRYPEIPFDQISALNPDIILLSSEPFPFKQKNVDQIQKIFPKSKVLLADGEYFSWYGSRMIDAPQYFNKLNSTVLNIVHSV